MPLHPHVALNHRENEDCQKSSYQTYLCGKPVRPSSETLSWALRRSGITERPSIARLGRHGTNIPFHCFSRPGARVPISLLGRLRAHLRRCVSAMRSTSKRARLFDMDHPDAKMGPRLRDHNEVAHHFYDNRRVRQDASERTTGIIGMIARRPAWE